MVRAPVPRASFLLRTVTVHNSRGELAGGICAFYEVCAVAWCVAMCKYASWSID